MEGGLIGSISVTSVLGQPIVQDVQNKVMFIWLRKGVYRKAGKIYGWRGAGVGVSKTILLYADRHQFKIAVICGGLLDRYYLAKFPANYILDTSLKLRAVERRMGVEICVVPFNTEFFTTVRDQKTVLSVVKAIGERSCGK